MTPEEAPANFNTIRDGTHALCGSLSHLIRSPGLGIFGPFGASE